MTNLPAKTINEMALQAGQQELQILTNALKATGLFDIQYQINLSRSYFFVDVWKGGLHHLYLSNASVNPGYEPLIDKVQDAVNRLRAIAREHGITVRDTSAANDDPVVVFPNARTAARIQLHSNKFLDFANISALQFDIEDIAHSLSHLCRFTGHTNKFYSVAQHSVLVSELVPEEHALAALLHDAAEAYCGDVSSPLKSLLPVYQQIIEAVEKQLYQTVGLPWPMDKSIKHADLVALVTEQRDLLPHNPSLWVGLSHITPHEETIVPMPPEQAKQAFLDRYFMLQSRELFSNAMSANQ